MEMIKFKLINENKEEEYSIDLDFKDSNEFLIWSDNTEFESFMDKMETGSKKWCGVHDGTGGEENGIEWSGYSSYEIKDFKTAIQKWSEFFKEQNKLL